MAFKRISKSRAILSLFGALPRSEAPELLDGPDVDPAALAENLRDLRRTDALLGAAGRAWRELRPMLARCPRGLPFTLLDVATGGADLPRRLAALARRAGYDVRPLASDRLLAALREAGRPADRLPLVQHDALAIPLRDAGVDFTTCALALHHFAPDAAAALLRELARASRRGVVVVDLRRSRLAHLGALLLARGPWHAMARHDGPLSVLRAYTIPEARQIVRRAGVRGVVRAAGPFLMTIAIEGD